eukprot:TRINITY_DN17083_c0_g2_i3.p1 TRINITY_DN17083_c0_g2~~TRINITY_DN17083_c0_g2_i3.p1  ORF type:complete len:458 (+),score=110.04 TRINITY_DN17083_c0_g2_i3:83-1375(+)
MAADGDEIEPGDLDADLPPLLDEDGRDISTNPAAPATMRPQLAGEPARGFPEERQSCDATSKEEAAAVEAAEALRNAAVAAARHAKEETTTAADALKLAMLQAEESAESEETPSPHTLRMVAAISRGDHEECEDAILQGANVNADCGAGMRALHIAAMRGLIFLTELLISHGAVVNQRDKSGNTPLLYAVHFYRQHNQGVQMTAQLLYHKADPFYRVKDGQLAGKSALDLAEKACLEPQMDDEMPRQMCALVKLATEHSDDTHDAITKVWMGVKSQHQKLYTVSAKSDRYGYVVQNIDWVTPANAKNAQGFAPVKIAASAAVISEEKFTRLKDYLFSDEGDNVKVYINFPEAAAACLGSAESLEVRFELQAFDVKLRTPAEKFRLRIDPLFGSIDTERCKHRVSTASRKVTLTLSKRHRNRTWNVLQKSR